MPKQNFISVPVSDSIQAIFDDFVKTKDITKTAALTDMLELYMIATDEDLYLKLKKEYLKTENVKDMIASKNYIFEENVFDTYLFMKLGHAQDIHGNIYNGHETMQKYIEDEKTRGYTWFSTESLFYGMSKRQVAIFKQAIERGHLVKILFAFGQDAGGTNDIHYSADVIDLQSSIQPTPCPEPDAFPDIWYDKARIWIKIKNLKPESTITVDQLIVKSTGTSLKKVITNSQYHFGYVSLR